MVSVIISTYNGRAKILNVLASLEKQTVKDFEVIVMIDGSTDGTIDILKGYSTFLTLKVIEQKNGGRADVRNNGANAAQGNLLIFFDDDVRPLPDCIELHKLHHQNKPGSILAGCALEDEHLAKNDFQVYRAQLSKEWLINIQEGQPQPLESLYLSAANFSISKEIFQQLNGFDKDLRDCEDYDLAVRAYKLGIPTFFSKEVKVWHDDFPTLHSFIKRQLEYKYFNQYLIQHKSAQYGQLSYARLERPKKIKAFLFSIFKFNYWLALIENGQLMVLPKSLRYKVYSWIITAHSNYKEYI